MTIVIDILKAVAKIVLAALGMLTVPNFPTGQVCWVHHKVGAPADLKCTEAWPWP